MRARQVPFEPPYWSDTPLKDPRDNEAECGQIGWKSAGVKPCDSDRDANQVKYEANSDHAVCPGNTEHKPILGRRNKLVSVLNHGEGPSSQHYRLKIPRVVPNLLMPIPRPRLAGH